MACWHELSEPTQLSRASDEKNLNFNSVSSQSYDDAVSHVHRLPEISLEWHHKNHQGIT
jgi:hypothetical protein